MHSKARVTFVMVAILFITSCATTGTSISKPLPGRHAYSVQTLEGYSWVEFDCEEYDHYIPKIGRGIRVRSFYSDQRALTLGFERENGTRQMIKLPGCKDIQPDGQFPERAFNSFRSQSSMSCASEDAAHFLKVDNRSYRCWGSIEQTGYVVEYFYRAD